MEEEGMPISSMAQLNQDIEINPDRDVGPAEDAKEAPESDSVFDRFKGAIIGALCGDAIGAVLEFYFKEITDKIGNA